MGQKDALSKQQAVAAGEKGIKAELEALDTQLGYCTLRAPIAGRLGLVQVQPGQTIAIGTTIAEVIDLDTIDVRCFVPPHLVRRLALDQTAQIAATQAAEGKVAFIAVQAQPETGNFAVKVRFPNPDLGLRANPLCMSRC